MSDTEKPAADFSEIDAVEVDENGNPRVVMETLQNGGSDEAVEGLVRTTDDDG